MPVIRRQLFGFHLQHIGGGRAFDIKPGGQHRLCLAALAFVQPHDKRAIAVLAGLDGFDQHMVAVGGNRRLVADAASRDQHRIVQRIRGVYHRVGGKGAGVRAERVNTFVIPLIAAGVRFAATLMQRQRDAIVVQADAVFAIIQHRHAKAGLG